jgi:hypothetical protein
MRYVTQVRTERTDALQQTIRSEQVPDPGQPIIAANRHIHDQVDAVVANKQARDTWEASYAERVCGCPHCRQAYKETLAFYATLGTRQPARERVSAGDLSWYSTPVGDSQLERR